MSQENSVSACVTSDNAYLTHLPGELLFQIINDVAVDDIDAFASTCRQIRNLADERLARHRSLKRAHTTVALNDQSVQLGPHGTFINFLVNLAQNPDIVFYPRRLVVVVPKPHNRPSRTIRERQQERANNDRALLRQLMGMGTYVWACPSIPARLKSAWCVSIRRSIVGSEKGCIYALFLAVLPNLRELSIDDSDSDCFHILTMMESLTSTDTPNTTALQNLTKATLTSENYTSTYFKHFTLWTHVPSLRYLSFTRLALDCTKRIEDMDCLGVSKITELVLLDCVLHEPHLRQILRSMPDLEKFTHKESHSYGASPATMVQSLADNYGDKLQELTLRFANHMTDSPSFTGLRALKKLDITPEAFLHNEMHTHIPFSQLSLDTEPANQTHIRPEADIAKFVDILPPSIAVVNLEANGHWYVVRCLLAGMAAESGMKLPKLQEISVGGFPLLMTDDGDERAVKALLREIYEKTSITVKTVGGG